MKTGYNIKIISWFLGFTIAAGSFTSFLVLAQDSATSESVVLRTRNFCTRLETFGAQINGREEKERDRLLTKRQEQLSLFAKKRSLRDDRLTELREQLNEKRFSQFERLEEKATTDVQKAAVAKFKEAMSAAIAVRQTAIDTAIQAYRREVDNAFVARKNAVDAALRAFKGARDSALVQAQNDCINGVDSQTTRATYMTAMKAAQDKFKIDREAIEKLKDSHEALTSTRRAAIQKALDDFKTAAEKTKTDLKIAFGIS